LNGIEGLRVNPAIKRGCLQIVHMLTIFLHGEYIVPCDFLL
jgi:hypothetical protein